MSQIKHILAIESNQDNIQSLVQKHFNFESMSLPSPFLTDMGLGV